MTPTEIFFVSSRFSVAVLCLIALLTVWRHPRIGTPSGTSTRPLLVFAAGLLMMAGVLTLNDIRAALSPGEQMATYAGAWVWVLFDAGVPLLLMLALPLARQRDAALAMLERASVTDALTDLTNRRGFFAAASSTLPTCRRRGEAAAVVMFDIDRFKAINDGHGHAAGDAVLRGVADTLRRHVRASDVAARLGGEEFALLCPGMTTAQATDLAERVRKSIREEVPHPAGHGAFVTASAGVAALERSDAGLDAALIAADRALYAAKEAGRDRVMIADSLA